MSKGNKNAFQHQTASFFQDSVISSNTTRPPMPEQNPTIRLWSKILPGLVLGALVIYFVNVVYYYYRKLKNLDELSAEHSYLPSGALGGPRGLAPDSDKHKRYRTHSTVLESTESAFSFRPNDPSDDKSQ